MLQLVPFLAILMYILSLSVLHDYLEEEREIREEKELLKRISVRLELYYRYLMED